MAKVNMKHSTPDKYQDYIRMRAQQDAFIVDAVKLIETCAPLVETLKDDGTTNSDNVSAFIAAYESLVAES